MENEDGVYEEHPLSDQITSARVDSNESQQIRNVQTTESSNNLSTNAVSAPLVDPFHSSDNQFLDRSQHPTTSTR